MALLPSGFGSVGAYQIARSLRFNSPDTAYLNWTFGTPTNNKIYTWSIWAKRSDLTATTFFVLASCPTAGFLSFGDGTNPVIRWNDGTADIITSSLYRDPSAWYHIVVAVDTTQATASNRVKIYVNGSQLTAFSTAVYPSLNASQNWNSAGIHNIGRRVSTSTLYYDGYMTEVNFIDGQALTPSSFGETDAATGVWKPKKYTGTYGTNGFYLNFSDNSGTTATTLGKDSSGNGNNWTPNNFSVTAGAGNDSLVDTPTPYGTDTGAGGEVRGNYATLNPLGSGVLPLSNGNLDGANGSGAWRDAVATIGVSSGKWYCEMVPTSGSATQGIMFGITQLQNQTGYLGSTASGYAYYGNDGKKYNNSVSATYGATVADNDIVGVALDMDAGTLSFYKNNVSQGTAYSGLSGTFFIGLSCNGTATATVNFGQRPFAYTAPSGYKALCTQNLPTPTIGATASTMANKYFDATLYTGTSASQSVTNSGSMQPDLVWIKSRSAATDHKLTDAVRGVTKGLISDTTGAETTDTNGLTAFNSNGFTVGSDSNYNNGTGPATYVGWQWNAGGSNATNTAGSITSTVRANASAGFSIVNWTGSTSSSSQTVGHGLGVAPSLVILKNRNIVDNWWVWSSTFPNTTTDYLQLNTTIAKTTSGNAIWGAGMTSTVCGVKPSNFVSLTSDNVIMYCFAPVAGYSAFGSYTGNGSTDGPFCFTGFQPRYVLVKRTDNTSDWYIWDTARDTYNVETNTLLADTSGAETSATSIDGLSNGFKCRSATVVNVNAATYIYAAFSAYPFKYSLGR